ncbi:lantibiotic dehydratase [Sphingobacterium sp. Lzh-3]|uniref:lantibiotic dehydratase n=1 Tax=Sphingobacterium sp. Lzh-3 TaxID=3382150 RepID=UPI00398D326B
MKDYQVQKDSLLVRTPSFTYINSLTEDDLSTFINDRQFLESLYLASADLYSELEKLEFDPEAIKRNKRLVQKLAKYILRASTRSTPFGKFSSVTLGPNLPNESEKIVLGELKQKTRLDMDVLCELKELILSKDGVRENLRFTLNSTSYILRGSLRYYEGKIAGFRKKFNISSVELDEYLKAVYNLCKNTFVDYVEIRATIQNFGFSVEETDEYINSLISSQIIVSELEPRIIGGNFLYDLLDILSKKEALKSTLTIINSSLTRIIRIIEDIDRENRPDNISKYKEVETILIELGLDLTKKKLFQVDSYRELESGGLAAKTIEEIEKILPLFCRLSKPIYRGKMQLFARKFFQKFETREVPLLEVLDPELGIGYHFENSISDETECLIEDFLLKKLVDAHINNTYEIALKESDINDFPLHKYAYPSTSTLVVKTLNHDGKDLLIESFGGMSSGNILGRFSHLGSQFKEELKNIADYEKERNPDLLFCDLSHLPDNRVANILNRDFSLDYEIPFLSNSYKNPEHTIPLDDIMVSVIDDFVYLRSKKIGRFLSPKIISAHNTSYNTLKLYEFLVDVQTQHNNLGAYFYWGKFSKNFEFLPRVVLKNVIIFPATWNLSTREILGLSNDQDVHFLREKYLLPRFIELKENDNDLVIDLNNEISIAILKESIKKMEKVILREHLLPELNVISQSNNGILVPASNQYVLKVENSKIRKIPRNERFSENGNVKRKFELSSEWLYYKIYMSESNFDTYLVKIVKPIISELRKNGMLEKFFFIKYEDSDTHIRLRICLKSLDEAWKCRYMIAEKLSSEEILRLSIEEYDREIERYGEHNIESIENIFYEDSLHFLDHKNKDYSDELNDELKAVAIRVNTIMDSFAYAWEEKFEFFERLIHDIGYFGKKENRVNGDLIFRDLGKDLIRSLHLNSEEDRMFSIHSRMLKESNAPTVFENLMRSIIHMTVNRYLAKFDRTKEYMIYYLLKKGYTSLIKINNYVV